MSRREAQDMWQETLTKKNKVGWGADGYKAYTPIGKEIKTPVGLKVGTARRTSIVLPPTRSEAIKEVRLKIGESLERLNVNPVVFFNACNKKKQKFLTPKQVQEGLHQFTKLDISKLTLVDVMEVLDPDRTKKVTVRMLKDNLKKLCSTHTREASQVSSIDDRTETVEVIKEEISEKEEAVDPGEAHEEIPRALPARPNKRVVTIVTTTTTTTTTAGMSAQQFPLPVAQARRVVSECH